MSRATSTEWRTPEPSTPARHSRRGGRALGGVAAQGSQAAASFALQILAVRLLGLEGLGYFAAIYAIIVLGTAVVSGFVGDSLTVLDRHDRSLRAGLQVWWITVSTGSGLALAGAMVVSGLVDDATAVMVGIAASAFLLEDTLRRLLMASLHFWRIVFVDLSGLTGAVLVLWALSTNGAIELIDFFIALAVGQTVALLVAVTLLPREERRFVSVKAANLRAVAAYGSWRAMQQAIKPALLAAIRVVGIALVSATAVGELDAARIYISPAMILIAGLTTVMFAGYAAQRDVPLSRLLRRSDKAATQLLAGVSMMAVVALVLEPWAGELLTGGEFELSILGVVGWASYAAATASAAPYSVLAAVRGRQSVVVGLRAVESSLALVVVMVILWMGAPVLWAPYVLAVTYLVGGLILRTLVLTKLPERPSATL